MDTETHREKAHVSVRDVAGGWPPAGVGRGRKEPPQSAAAVGTPGVRLLASEP